MTINNDNEFKSALGGLPRAGQRQVAARFAENVLALSTDARVKNAISTAKRADITEDELAAALTSAKKASVDSFTQCGTECDWGSQAAILPGAGHINVKSGHQRWEQGFAYLYRLQRQIEQLERLRA